MYSGYAYSYLHAHRLKSIIMHFIDKVCPQTPMILPQHRNSHEQLPFEEAHSEDLLRREAFDWADDVEEALACANKAITIPPSMPSPPTDRPCSPVPWIERNIHSDNASCSSNVDNFSTEALYEPPDPEPTRLPGFMTRFGFRDPLSTIEEEEEPLDGLLNSEVQATDSDTTSPTEDGWSGSHDATSHTSSVDESLPNEQESTSQCPSDAEEAAAVAPAQQNLDSIFADRQLWIEIDEDIHHFNWMGMRSYTHSSTTPSESLAIILSKPKSLQGSDMWRKQSVLNRAMHYVDPVIVRLDGPDDGLLELRGSTLTKESHGRVLKFYSPHGEWMNDQRDATDACVDYGSIKIYGASSFAIGNGFVESSRIPSTYGWMESKAEMSGGLESLPRKLTWKPKPSLLRHCQSVASFIGPAPRRRHITTCGTGAPPEVYTSFPTPVFGRHSATKILWEKSRRKLATALSSLKGSKE
jgi:hypothetical protein